MNLEHKVVDLVGKEFSTKGSKGLTIKVTQRQEKKGEKRLQLEITDKRDTNDIDSVVDIDVIPAGINPVNQFRDVRFCAQVKSPEHTMTYAIIHKPGSKSLKVITGIDIPHSDGPQTKYPWDIAVLQRR